MGRAPCCDKANVKKGPWSPEEDAKLKSYIEKHGTGGNWIALPQKIGLKRCGKSCRLRWLNYLRPNIKHGGFSEEEDRIILSLYVSIGSRWSIIAAQLPGRTDNDIKNYWNTRLKKKLLGKQRKDHQQGHKRKANPTLKQKAVDCGFSKGVDHNHHHPHNPSMDSNINLSSSQMFSYWSSLSVPPPTAYPPSTMNEQEKAYFNDHASIRKLLIKLGGGRAIPEINVHQNMIDYNALDLQVSSNDFNYTYGAPLQIHQQLAPNMVMSTSSSSILVDASSITATQYSHMEGSSFDQGGGQNSTFPPELEELMTSNIQREDHGLEFFYGESMTHDHGSTSEEWNDMSSLISLPSAASNMVECQFDDELIRYSGEL